MPVTYTYRCSQCGVVYSTSQAVQSRGVCSRDGAALALVENTTPRLPAWDISLGGGVPVHAPLPAASDGRRREATALLLVPTVSDERALPQAAQVINSLASFAPFALEIGYVDGRTMLIVRCPSRAESAVRAVLTAVYRNVDIRVLEDREDPALLIDRERQAGVVSFRLSKPDGLPLKTYRNIDFVASDPIKPLVGAVTSGVGEGSVRLVQCLVHSPAPEDWSARYRREMLRIQRRGLGLPAWEDIWPALALSIGAVLLVLYFLFLSALWPQLWMPALGLGLLYLGIKNMQGSGIQWNAAIEEHVAEKVRMPAYHVSLRAGVVEPGEAAAGTALTALTSAFRTFDLEAGNSLLPVLPARDGLASFSTLDAPTGSRPAILGDEELATLFHLPTENIPDMFEMLRVEHIVPNRNDIAPAESGWLVGHAGREGMRQVPVYLPVEAFTQAHGIFLGTTRMGKSTLGEHIFERLAGDRQRAVVLIDPHGDFLKVVLQRIPEDRIEDVLVLDTTRGDMLPVMNLLDIRAFNRDPEQTVEAVVQVAHALYQNAWGARMEVPFRMTMLALALANTVRTPENYFTIVDDAIALLSMRKEERARLLAEILPAEHPQSDIVRTYFEVQFDQLNSMFRQEVISPVLSKLNAMQNNTPLRAILGRPNTTIDLARAIRERKILLVNPGMTVYSNEMASFIGSFVLNTLMRVITRQGELAPAERVPVSILVDEAQVFTGFDFGQAMSMIAKFGGNLIGFTQGRKFVGISGNILRDDQNAMARIMANVTTMAVFRMAGDDANWLEETEFQGAVSAMTLNNLEAHTCFVRFLMDGRLRGPMLVRTLPPPAENPATAARVLARRAAYSDTMEKVMKDLEFVHKRAFGLPTGAAGDVHARRNQAPPVQGSSDGRTPSMEEVLKGIPSL
jgi:hypothetical protein